jgi:hypothetical protein
MPGLHFSAACLAPALPYTSNNTLWERDPWACSGGTCGAPKLTNESPKVSLASLPL